MERHKSPGIEQIPAKLIREGSRKIRSDIYEIISSIGNMKEWPEEWKESIMLPIYKKGDSTDCINYSGKSLLPTTYKILSNIMQSRITAYTEVIIGNYQCGFQLQMICSSFVKYLRKNGNKMEQRINYL